MKKLIALTLALAPLSTFAQINNINDIAGKATNIGTLVITLLISFSVIWIIVNVVRYLIAGGEESRKKAGPAILWGIVGLFVILSIWGLVAILKNSFGTGRNQLDTTQVPTLLPTPYVGDSSSNQPGYPANYNSYNDPDPWVDQEDMSTYDPTGTAYPQSGN